MRAMTKPDLRFSDISLREVIKAYGIWPEKSLGQNFLFDFNLIGKIARAALPLDGRTVIEIGPGPGGLTRMLLAYGANKLVAIEQDARCLGALSDIAALAPGRLEVVQADALKVDETSLAEGRVKIVANLPYNIATVLLFKWLENILFFESLTLMFQKEVADRIAAAPGTKDYGRVSVMAQWLCEVHHHFDISPEAFIPPPKVTSSVISLIPRPTPLAPANKTTLQTLCKATFNQRRKTLRSSLKQLIPAPESVLEEAAILPSRRPEELSVEEFCALARAYDAHHPAPHRR